MDYAAASLPPSLSLLKEVGEVRRMRRKVENSGLVESCVRRGCDACDALIARSLSGDQAIHVGATIYRDDYARAITDATFDRI